MRVGAVGSGPNFGRGASAAACEACSAAMLVVTESVAKSATATTPHDGEQTARVVHGWIPLLGGRGRGTSH